MALQHESDNRLVAMGNLLAHIACYRGLQRRIFLGVGVTAIDHNIGGEARGPKICLTLSDPLGALVRAMTAPPQHNVTIPIAAGFKHRHLAFRVDAQKAMRIGN